MPGGYVGGRAKDPSKLSTNPRQVRNRLRRNAGRVQEAVLQDMTMLYGKPVEEWDLEELARGRVRNKNGGFAGGRPKWITVQVQLEAKRRLMEDVYGMLSGHVAMAVRTMGQLLISEEVDDKGRPIVDAKTKFAAAAFIIEHIIGKPQAMVKVEASQSETQSAIAAAIVLDDGLPQGHLTIDGEFEDTDEGFEEVDDDERE